jgi:RNA polymerase sigma-70 factor (family 1)
LTDQRLQSDKQLFHLIAEGNESAFEELFHLYVPQIEPVISKMVKSEAVAKDLIQDIFLSLWLSREKLAAVDSPRNWIFKISYNRTYSWLEQQSTRSNATMELPDSSNHTEESVYFAETARLVKEAIRHLPAQTQKIYLLSREEGLKNAEIAERLNLSLQTVKNTLYNAGKAIKEFLSRHGVELPLLLIIYNYFRNP